MRINTKYPLFVYGTLKREQRAHRVLNGATFLSEAKVQGTLVDLGPFPGLILNSKEYEVSGELYDITPLHLASTDMMENVGDFYNRDVVNVKLPDNTTRKAYVYFLPSEFGLRYGKVKGGNWNGDVHSAVQVVQPSSSSPEQSTESQENQFTA